MGLFDLEISFLTGERQEYQFFKARSIMVIICIWLWNPLLKNPHAGKYLLLVCVQN